ncbi:MULTISPECIES: GDP-L-fucose synthase [Pseudovibrio]|uniref:GDP-L-fucose synthase n=1 Tax=Stappiaceae TaxID=2821832 RepID=UPI0023656024|nr:MULTISPECIES: GDP-L-fucose synthase [Pseudovibrio]MDD7911406.1 GDP-L-fucose synthase [Pseudovibrio exalbescens]MDX5592907.1 GDP-L-fucose synthase [Pseudovibrio sp. SPO723]
MSRELFDLAGERVWVAGHGGMVGSALLRRLEREPCEVVTAPRDELDLRDPQAVDFWLATRKPTAIFLPAAKVGGILANNTYPADFLYDNLMIAANVIHSAHKARVKKLLFLGSSCIYPKFARQPITEASLLTGPLEPTNQWYALAKIAGVKLCQAYRRQHGCDFISAMPTNLYGPGDNFDLETSHVIPALMRKVHEAKANGEQKIVMWGTGAPRREFLYVEDCADALVFLMKNYSEEEHINLGSGEEVSIKQLAVMICKAVGFEGRITHDLSKPDGTPRKLMDNARLQAMGWQPSIGLEQGLKLAYAAFLKSREVPDDLKLSLEQALRDLGEPVTEPEPT